MREYYKFFTKYCDTNKYEEMKTKTNSPYLALSKIHINVSETKKARVGIVAKQKLRI